jgi:hypothetical protein
MIVPVTAGVVLVASATGVAGALAAIHNTSLLPVHGPADQGSG